MSVGLAIVVVNFIIVLFNLDQLRAASGPGSLWMAAFTSVVSSGLWIWMMIGAALGIAWTRVLATVLGAIAALNDVVRLVGELATLVGDPGSTGLTVSYMVGHTALNALRLTVAIVLLVLLWLQPTSAYYTARSAARRQRARRPD